MYSPGAFKKKGREEIKRQVRNEGWEAIELRDDPGKVYLAHRHPKAKLLALIAGSMEVKMGNKKYTCRASDKLVIPGEVEHEAVVGPKGCVFLWSERLERKG